MRIVHQDGWMLVLAWRPRSKPFGRAIPCWFGNSIGWGRNLRHLVNTVHELATRGVGFKVLTGHGASIDPTTAAGKMVFGIFAALSEFERELISERTKAGLASARARGRKGGAPFKMTPAKVRLAPGTMGQPKTKVADLCRELGVTRQTLYRHVSPEGALREDGRKLLLRA
jgi:DNA invertase Pin-like site-specific DNA recombinase